jgi:hypothetical protein
MVNLSLKKNNIIVNNDFSNVKKILGNHDFRGRQAHISSQSGEKYRLAYTKKYTNKLLELDDMINRLE